MPNSTRTHEYPQGDLGCTITVEEVYSGPDAPLLKDAEIDWSGVTPTAEQLAEAEDRASRAKLAVVFDRREKAHGALKDEFGAWFMAAVMAGDITSQESADFTGSSEAEEIYKLLRRNNFEGAVLAINALDDQTYPLADAAFKALWTGKLNGAIAAANVGLS